MTDTNDAAFIMLLTNACTAFGEIGVISESIMSFIEKLDDESKADNISDTGRSEVRVLGVSILEILELTIVGYETKNMLLSGTIQLYREEVTRMSEIVKTRHYKRLHGEGGRSTITTIYADICYAQERLIYYCDIVADSLYKYNKAVSGEIASVSDNTANTKQRIHGLFLDKYEMLNISEDEEGRIIDLSE